MRRFALLMVASLVLTVGIGYGVSASQAEAGFGPDCYIKCKNGQEVLCCPRLWQNCIQTGYPC